MKDNMMMSNLQIFMIICCPAMLHGHGNIKIDMTRGHMTNS